MARLSFCLSECSSRTETWSDLPKGGAREGLICILEGSVNMVECVLTTRRTADVLMVSRQDFPHLGVVKITGHNKRSLLSITASSSSRAWFVSACGGIYTAVITADVNSLGIYKVGIWSWGAPGPENSPKKWSPHLSTTDCSPCSRHLLPCSSPSLLSGRGCEWRPPREQWWSPGSRGRATSPWKP